MLVSEWLAHVNYALRGTDDDTPTVGDSEADQWIATLNRKKDELYRNAKVLWDETYKVTPPAEAGTVSTAGTTTLTGTNTFFTDYRVGDTILVSGETVRTIATITSNTSLTVTAAFSNTASGLSFTRTTIIDDGVASYSLNRAFIAPANKVLVTTTASDEVYYDIIHPRASVGVSGRHAFISSINPKTLTFTGTIASTENIVGGTLTVPGYYMPADVSAATDVLPLPDPYWGVMSVASEIAFNDITYEDKATDLNAKANALYMQMVRNNRRGTYGNPNTSVTSMYRIRNTETR